VSASITMIANSILGQKFKNYQHFINQFRKILWNAKNHRRDDVKLVQIPKWRSGDKIWCNVYPIDGDEDQNRYLEKEKKERKIGRKENFQK
jgi:hypothetical protein